MSGRPERVACGVVVACLVYAASLVVQRFVPAVHDALALDLGSGLKPTYYLRGLLAVAVGLVAAIVAKGAWSERALVWATGGLVAFAALLVVLFP